MLTACGVELGELDSDGGYPVFRTTLVGAAVGRPKNLIFASSVKPDIRFRDAVNNDIEIVENADRVLIFDRPIPVEGLRWSDLQDRWAEENQMDAQTAKKTLYRRLYESLPTNSPPQRLLFREFFTIYGRAVPVLPVLLPEVWLHWDPKTVRDRGPRALLQSRMDFLMLFSAEIRVVIEVDVQQHYADQSGRADPSKYSAMASADRELRLAGYEVYHFGGKELTGDSAIRCVRSLFDSLFAKHRVSRQTFEPLPTGANPTKRM